MAALLLSASLSSTRLLNDDMLLFVSQMGEVACAL
jgi:hypothetical protein